MSDRIHFKKLGRELAMQFLFQDDVSEESVSDEQKNLFWEQLDESEVFPENRDFRKAKQYAEKIIDGVIENLTSIDDDIAVYAKKWDINRMAVVDRNLMRVAVYEMKFCPDIPPIVSINEAVEISKKYSSDKSSVFINGILNGIKNSLDRPAREAVDKL